METLDKLTGKCQHQYETTVDEGDEVYFKRFTCKKCGFNFVKKFQKEEISYPELEGFKRYLNKPFQKTVLNEDVIKASTDVVKQFLKKGKTRGLVFHDKRGTGKTHLAVKILQNFKRKFKKRIYAVNFSSLVFDRVREINLAKSGYYNPFNPPKSFEVENEALSSEVLLLDEVGKGNSTAFVNGLLYTFVNDI